MYSLFMLTLLIVQYWTIMVYIHFAVCRIILLLLHVCFKIGFVQSMQGHLMSTLQLVEENLWHYNPDGAILVTTQVFKNFL